MRVDQLVAGFATGDAISNYALELQDILLQNGFESSIFSPPQYVDMDGMAYCRDYKEYKSNSSSDVIIFHFSVGSELTNFFTSLTARKILVYHNITPARYFKVLNREKYIALNKGRDELGSLREKVSLALGVSEYNRKELEGLGFNKTGVLNLILNEKILKGDLNKELFKKYSDNFTNIISVGRLTPNKKIEDVIKVFYYYKKCINHNSRLFLIGSLVGENRYVECLRGLTAVFDLPDVIFTRHVTRQDLRTYYNLADIFITMSEHEGFCIPLLEGMYFRIPIIAYSSCAIPEILGKSGILLDEKDYPVIAELISLIFKNNKLKKRIIDNQSERLRFFDKKRISREFLDYIRQ